MPEFAAKTRVIASNTGPFISLEKLPNGFEILRRLYDHVIIPPQVLEELSAGLPSHSDYLKEFSLKDFVIVERVETHDHDLDSLELGEKYAIALALKRQVPLLIEERAGREIARAKRLQISGIAGQVRKAYDQGYLSLQEAIEKLEILYKAQRISYKIFSGLKENILSKT